MTVPGVYNPSQGGKSKSNWGVAICLSCAWLVLGVTAYVVFDDAGAAWSCMIISNLWQAAAALAKMLERRS